MFGKRPAAEDFLNTKIKDLEGWDYTVTSEPTPEYNCIAHAADESHQCWWPSAYYDTYWPESAPCEETREAFVSAYASIGYEICADETYDRDYDKIALYLLEGKPNHAAKQIDSRYWSSKLGGSYDIRHPLRALEAEYGNPVIFMRRKKR